MTSMLFRAGKSLLVGEAKNKEGSTWHLELQYEMVEGQPRPLGPEMVRVTEAMIINPDFTPFLNVTESDVERRFRDVIHENIMPFLATLREAELGGRIVAAYERDRRGLALREGTETVWCPLNEVLADLAIAESLAVEGIRTRLVMDGIVESIHRGRLSEAHKELTEDLAVYMKINPFRDITMLREGTEVRPVGYYAGCVVVEADGEEFWRPCESVEYFPEERKSDMWYFKQVDGNKTLPDPLTALPSKVALRTTDKNRRKSSLQWDPKADTRKVIGHLTPEKDIENNHSVMGESVEGTILHHFFYRKRYNHGALGGSDMRNQEPALNRDKDTRDHHGNKHLRDHPRSEAPKPYEYDGKNAEPEYDDGTGVQNPHGPKVKPAKESVEELISSILDGASVTAIFAERLNPEKEKELKKEALRKTFPGAQQMVNPGTTVNP